MSGARRIQGLLHGKLPISRAMGVKVEDYDGRRLVLSAPLAENANHLGTASAGASSRDGEGTLVYNRLPPQTNLPGEPEGG